MRDAVRIMFQLRPDNVALVVVDMQNDFVRVGAPLEVPDARETIDVHLDLLSWFRAHQRLVVFTRFVAGPARTLMWNWSPQIAPPVCSCWP
ncbi:MAG: ureidoacrylate peracid hydrolase, partial [Chloroflexota bacterium]|nr:ureidoacrylate peracid hydrolase [Chloroflexota bacterium]